VRSGFAIYDLSLKKSVIPLPLGRRRDSMNPADSAGETAMMGLQETPTRLFYDFCLDEHVTRRSPTGLRLTQLDCGGRQQAVIGSKPRVEARGDQGNRDPRGSGIPCHSRRRGVRRRLAREAEVRLAIRAGGAMQGFGLEAQEEALHLTEVAANMRAVRNRQLYRLAVREIEKSFVEARTRRSQAPPSEAAI
jgi:hypothetical protein